MSSIIKSVARNVINHVNDVVLKLHFVGLRMSCLPPHRNIWKALVGFQRNYTAYNMHVTKITYKISFAVNVVRRIFKGIMFLFTDLRKPELH